MVVVGYRTVNYYNPPLKDGSWGRLYSLQNLKYFFRAIRAGGYIFYKTSKFSSALRAGGYIFYKIRIFFSRFARGCYIFYKNSRQNRSFFECFWTVSALITATNPKFFRALRAQGFGVPKNFRASREEVIFFTKCFKKIQRFARDVIFFTKSPKIFSRAKRGRYYFLQKSEKKLQGGNRGVITTARYI